MTPVLTNQPQRIYANGRGRGDPTNLAIHDVPPEQIESPAREGYLDGLAGKGFSRHYDAAPGPWQRNYEIGRLWACGMRACGIAPPKWRKGSDRVPQPILDVVEEIVRRIGALRPEFEGMKAPRDDLPVLHEPLKFRRWRGNWRF